MNLGFNQNRNKEEIKKRFYDNNMPYILYFNELKKYFDKINEEEEESRLKFLKFFESSKFGDLTILLKFYYDYNEISCRLSLNKILNSIELYLLYYNQDEIQFLNELKKYKSVKLKIHSCKEETIHKYECNLLKFDKESNIEHFSLSIFFYNTAFTYNLEFPINFEKIITLDLAYTLVLDRLHSIYFPLTEYDCRYKFLNLKNLKLNFHYASDIDGGSVFDSPKLLIPNLSKNLKFCPLLENFELSYEIFEVIIDDLYTILKGIKCLKYLKSLYINSKANEINSLHYNAKEINIINTNEFFETYPEYIDYCPFLNVIKFEVSERLKKRNFI